jgi:hypothetical protein
MVRSFYGDYGSGLFYNTKKSGDALDDALDEYFNNLFDEAELMDEVFDEATPPPRQSRYSEPQSLEGARAWIADEGHQEPAENHKVSSLRTAKKGLEGIQKAVYGAR